MQLIVKVGGFAELQNIKLELTHVMPTKEASRLR